jgi:pimeloyl-ACP methyl ester carboxylesterase
MRTGMAIAERPKITCADIQKFNFPVLLLNGERSPKIYSLTYAAMRQCKPDIPPPLIVPNAAHVMQLANPGFFNKAVLEFLNQH